MQGSFDAMVRGSTSTITTRADPADRNDVRKYTVRQRPTARCYSACDSNAHGQTVTCIAGGKNDIVTGRQLRAGFEDRARKADAAG
jgi:hypothetical protein